MSPGLARVPLLAAAAAAALATGGAATLPGGGSALALPPPTAPIPSSAAVLAALQAPLAAPALGTAIAGEVADLSTGTVLYDEGADRPMMPASVVKLAVASAAIELLGSRERIHTEVLAAGPVTAGVLSGNLVLVGGGDVLLTAGPDTTYPQPATLSGLAEQVAAAGIKVVKGQVLGNGSVFQGPGVAPGWNPTYVTQGSVTPVSALEVDEGAVSPAPGAPRVTDPTLRAAQEFRTALALAGVTVTAGAAETAATPTGARTVATVTGATVADDVETMLTYSDNDVAESLGRLVALADGLPPTFAGAAQAVRDELANLGLPIAGVSLYDTSGLSRYDRVPVALLVALLRLAASGGHPELRPILSGLPVAAFRGTLATRYLVAASAPGAGVVHAKTGTLIDVTSLAGTVVDAQGRELVFAFITNSAASPGSAEPALDAAAAALARL